MTSSATASAIFTLNAPGLATARRLRATLGAGEIFVPATLAETDDTPFENATATLRALFAEGRPIIGVCASGILIRALAPLLDDKREESPVIALSPDGAHVVPLLGGHQGANALALQVAELLNGQAALTTAGETALGIALDAPPAGWRLEAGSDIKGVTSALLNGAPVALVVEAGNGAWLEDAAPWQADASRRITLSERASANGDVVLRPATLVMGLGCERGADPAAMIALAEATLDAHDLSPASLACVASLDLKADEAAMREAAAHFGVPLRLLDAVTLEAETPRLANPSETVYRAVGCHGVAEAAALAGAGPESVLLAPKTKTAQATCAIARGTDVVSPDEVGQGLGRLSLVGIGPGKVEWRTSAASRALAGAVHHVGYGFYLDLLGAAGTHATRHAFPLGAERERARAALDLAARGEDTAIICSGDAGIYGMASLVFELLDQAEAPDWRFVDVQVEPGITAMQVAAARAGAPLGHDFCAISLSDLLTPWPAIERRLMAAAEADFVIALYNPAGRKRRAPLNRALEILRDRRGADCPVIIARALGRADESVRAVRLGELDAQAIDMMTLLLFGNSETRAGYSAGRRFAYTPRGYGTKKEGAA